ALDNIPGNVESISVFERANNVAITAFEVKPVASSPLAYEAYLEIRNYGQPADVRLSVKGADQEIITRSVRLLNDARFRDVFDLFAPQTPPSKPALILGVPRVSWLPAPQGIVRKPVTTLWSRSHPIMQHVPDGELYIESATRIDSQNFAVVAGSKETPLIVVSDKPRRVVLTFDLSSSNFPLQSGFPIFMENVLAWFNREQVGQVALNHSPGIVELALPDAQVRD